ncbi:hypothetical protein [Flavobacterium chilense]|uniref:Nucleoside phosphorylase n=1 Tax=Flavobacterium chilense TaxID=946677 RepID=A0A1M6XGY6_9FLAO|nr:hypothetical protein [Flavobacterium chilense]SHL05222.1 Nucleoside phosphorylase [Flavobacterium chilense]
MIKLLLIEDNYDDYKVLHNILMENYDDIEIYPGNIDEHDLLRKNFRKLFSGETLVCEEAEDYFEKLQVNKFTGVLLDYQLDEGCKKTNGIQFYKEAKLNIPALILTKFTGVEYFNVEQEIKSENLEHLIFPLQKGLITNISQSQKKFYISNINEHILKIQPEVKNQGKLNSQPQITKKVLVVTTTKIETTEFQTRMETEGLEPRFSTKDTLTFWHYGIINNIDITMIKLTEMGSSKSGGSAISIMNSITHLNPDFIIMIGIAFGLRKDKQKIGDILVSRELQDYDSQKISEEVTIARGHRIPAGPTLLNRFDNAAMVFSSHEVEFGQILSGGTLADSKKFVEKLKEIFPEAIGGEMEGAGLQSSCQDKSKEWILIKGICDWGFDKNSPSKNADQKIAISNVCDFLFFTFKKFSF